MQLDKDYKNIFILAEAKNGELDTLALQMASRARQLADEWGCELNALILGHDLEAPVQQLSDKGFNQIYVLDHEEFEPYHPEVYVNTVTKFMNEQKPSLLLVGYTYLGMELGPILSKRLGTSLLSNCVDITHENDSLFVTRPMFNGDVFAKIEVNELPLIASIQKNYLPPIEGSFLPAKVIAVQPTQQADDVRAKILSILSPTIEGIDITKADILVSVGRGIGTKENIELARQLAEKLNGTVSGSRPITDMGWLPHECHVGISGRIVRPKIYIALGISGASQHVAGMVDSQYIIAINNDPNAPIFRVADCGIVGDIMDVVPALLESVPQA
ncbi:electron transfer flavoprotein subunit alpha/FixB family protein [Niallia oryzisoli]|uniref:electron transfer flavoprotein subunit alpha/FixB family protein n=1 Tax=Niallia oryzisoli TaxID=1737571 RepID=UPI00373528CC